MADLPFRLADPDLRARLGARVDREGKVVAALAELGVTPGRDVIVLEADDGALVGRLEALGARVVGVPSLDVGNLPSDSADVVVAAWTALEPASPDASGWIEGISRVARPGARLLIVTDYGRDEAAAVLPAPAAGPEPYRRRDAAFLALGFKIRVLHCWWSFASLEEAGEMLRSAFGGAGAALAAGLKRPRVGHKVAIYHRDL
ncbi:MAG TPA: hypothetical protein VFK38_02240 [Candidatus Limnocylindrales bacterium]|nr:hypothetical protein [Candidatus Limnocylindrales bacterium]